MLRINFDPDKYWSESMEREHTSITELTELERTVTNSGIIISRSKEEQYRKNFMIHISHIKKGCQDLIIVTILKMDALFVLAFF